MKIHRIMLVLLVSQTMLQGCGQGGTWFPNANPRARKQTHLDTPNNCSPAAQRLHSMGREVDGHLYDKDTRSVRKDKR